MSDTNKTGSEFTESTTEHGNNENGPTGLPLMSPEGKRLAAKSAPSSAFDRKPIPTSAVDRAMRGRR
jgi:hypothetical protein